VSQLRTLEPLPLEERWEAIEEAEKLYRDTRRRVSTDNIRLAKLASGATLVRIGEHAASRVRRVAVRRSVRPPPQSRDPHSRRWDRRRGAPSRWSRRRRGGRSFGFLYVQVGRSLIYGGGEPWWLVFARSVMASSTCGAATWPVIDRHHR
jgi:hypothetical protein